MWENLMSMARSAGWHTLIAARLAVHLQPSSLGVQNKFLCQRNAVIIERDNPGSMVLQAD